MTVVGLRRSVLAVSRRLREARMFATAMRSARHPIVAHIIPTRRCNLSCTYCNEFDSVSQPVPAAEMLRRVDLLAGLGTTIITLSGGEPMLHPELDEIIRRIRDRGRIATLITNGYPLTPERILTLNRAGLDYLQISVDNITPDDVSKKSLKVLDQKLRWLARYAEFDVTVNSVLGGPIRHPEDAPVIARRARKLGFTSTVGFLHDHGGQLLPLDAEQQQIYQEVMRLGNPIFSFAQYERFQKNIAQGLPNDWHCHAGSRYLYICEDGLVHWCSQQRGTPGIPLERYTAQDLEREYHSVKPCAPFCTVSCVHQTAMLDGFREKPQQTLVQLLSPRQEQDASFKPPVPVRLLSWMFVTSSQKRLFSKLALRLLRVTQS